MGLFTFSAHEIILTAVLKDELHKVIMYYLRLIMLKNMTLIRISSNTETKQNPI